MDRRHLRWLAGLSAAWLAAACTIYRGKVITAETLAAQAPKAKIVEVDTAAGPVVFSKEEPAVVSVDAVVGNVYAKYDLTAWDIADISSNEVVLKDGDRFRALASKPHGERVRFQGVKPAAVPLDEVVRAKIRVTDTAASVLASIGAAVLVVGVVVANAALDGNDDDPVEDTIDLFDCFVYSDTGSGESPRAIAAIPELKGSFDTSAEKEFWVMEWMPVEAKPGEDGAVSVPLPNATEAPRGLDEAKLVVVDHPAGVAVVPDGLGKVRAVAHPVPPDEAIEGADRDIREFLAARDGLLWHSAALDLAPDRPASAHDEIALAFSRPKGARTARLIVSASTSLWRSEFAREVLARHPEDPFAPYLEWEYRKLLVRMNTYYGWKTAQAIFAPGPLVAQDMVYGLDLGDVASDRVELRLSLPTGYWLIDRVAIDFSPSPELGATELAAAAVDGPDAGATLAALAAEDGTVLQFAPGDAPATLTFRLPPPKEGMERSLLLRTVSCYEMSPGPKKKDGSKGGRP